MPINICVPVLKRYDLLRRMVQSAQAGNIKPDVYYIINNGRNHQKLIQAIGDFDADAKVHTPKRPLGIAESWNWFIDHVPEDRIITNDDIEFAPNSLELLTASKADLVWAAGTDIVGGKPLRRSVGFSCFIIRDSCVQKLGKFDESISPGYGYYEDDDYLQRLDGRGTKPRQADAEVVECGLTHYRSSTLEFATHAERMRHHEQFAIAQANYIRKWGLEEEFKNEAARNYQVLA